MTPAEDSRRFNRDWAPWAILVALALYALSLAGGLPQRWTHAVVRGHAEDAEHAASAVKGSQDSGGDVSDETAPRASSPPIWAVIPFILLLAAIAILPLYSKTEHWWENNFNRFLVAVGLGSITLAYYALIHKGAVESHWPGHSIVEHQEAALQIGFVKAVLANALLSEYVPFIVLLFSLYTIAGGIRITGDLEAAPTTNAAFLAVGGLLASLIGTTGASMLLIRPLLETNRERKLVAHSVIFFIFIVSNCGGCLLPMGDPPLFLGYLQGVDFTWTLKLWPEWAFVNGSLLALYWAADHFYFYSREAESDIQRDVRQIRRLKISGLGVNGPLLIAVVLAVAVLDPTKPFPGTSWHPWMYFREAVQLGLVACSLLAGPRQPRAENRFNYDAIIEVAALFIGIFITMQPALAILDVNGAYLVERFEMGPGKFFWAAGGLSSFLDNAPTYLVFFQTARDPNLAGGPTGGVPEPILIAISLGAVFMGAMTYIGNGPNFMVKAIAEKSGVKMPSFFGYMAYSLLVLLPVLTLMNLIFVVRR